MFGEDIGFNVGVHRRTMNSYLGTFLSIVLYAVLLAYFLNKYQDLVEYSNTSFNESKIANGMNGKTLSMNEFRLVFNAARMVNN